MDTRPPRIARWLLGRLLPRAAREYVIGDLDEEYARHVAPSGRVRARTWYWSHALRSIVQTRDPESVMPQPDSFARPGFSTFFSSVPADFRHALRALRASPGYTAAAVLTLGLGIGATVAIFSAINDTVLRPYPFADPERIVALGSRTRRAAGTGSRPRRPTSKTGARARRRSATSRSPTHSRNICPSSHLADRSPRLLRRFPATCSRARRAADARPHVPGGRDVHAGTGHAQPPDVGAGVRRVGRHRRPDDPAGRPAA